MVSRETLSPSVDTQSQFWDNGPMDDTTRADRFRSLRAAEARMAAAYDEQTQRAIIYLQDGLPLADVLEALQTSRSAWMRRQAAFRARGGA